MSAGVQVCPYLYKNHLPPSRHHCVSESHCPYVCTTTSLGALTIARSKLCISAEFTAKHLEAMREIYNGN